jgi:ATP-dependent Clp protease adapter protein ClpS
MDREAPGSAKPKTRQRGEGYRVVLFNDDQHTMEEVTIQIMIAIDCDTETAAQIMLRAHSNGRATVTITSRTEARRVASVLREIALRVAVEQV